ncbi:SHOCT domain-containing protein [Kitasatospora sp. RB6PN24]|uniref:SHOCT domain-containing protein n=1 Tax=Kitasatospora humi TaxID=2893891 RepID=UPI001E621DFE|nr:SHOCT domain-containing protein [Kitasatospora humi]MCC9306214.1 SHOCT domain-containing protein [Kitasatospora humi]
MHDYPLLNVFWTMLEFFLWILWFFLLFKVITDIFRSHDLSGWGKAGWLFFVIVLPFLGILIYLVVRGHGMGRRDAEQAKQSEAAFRAYIRDAAAGEPGDAATGGAGGGAPSHVDELAKLADLKNRGAISEEEYQRAKDKLLG